ncbi:MAG: hypothetical protein WD770_07605 [Actinomycetota bacterium]
MSAWEFTPEERRELGPGYGLGENPTNEQLAAAMQEDELLGSMHAAVETYGETNAPDSYAGAYLDSIEGKRGLVVAFTGDPEEHREDLAARVSHPDRLHLVSVDRSASQLRAIQRSVEDDFVALRELGIIVTSVGLNDMANRVVIMVLELTDAVRIELTRRYGVHNIILEQGGPAILLR